MSERVPAQGSPHVGSSRLESTVEPYRGDPDRPGATLSADGSPPKRPRPEPRQEPCRDCNGTGKWAGPGGTWRCRYCHGTGRR
jgi:hypothetical protein